MDAMVSAIFANLATGEFQEQVFEVGGAVQGAQRVLVGQRGQDGLGLRRVEEHGLAADLHARGQRAQRRVLVALCDVDWGLQKVQETFAAFPRAKRYKDFRKMLAERLKSNPETASFVDDLEIYSADPKFLKIFMKNFNNLQLTLKK